MTAHDRTFYVGALLATVLVPGLILLGAPFDETRYVMGTLVGWAIALFTIVPSYILISRALSQEDNNRFYKLWAGGTMGRMAVVLVSVALFASLVDDAPIKTFLLSFFLGYMLLTGLELTMALGSKAPNGRHA